MNSKPEGQSNGPRVLHIVPALFGCDDGAVGGAERYALELARHMAQETPTTLLSFGNHGREETLGELKIRVLGGAKYVRGERSNPVSLALIAELRQADVVHCHQQHIVASSLAALMCKFSRRRVFVSDLGGGGWDISAYLSTDRWYHGHLHLSEYSRTVFQQNNKPWAHVILGGIDTEKFSPDEKVARNGKVLFVGRLLPHKGIDALVEALPPGMELEVIGPSHHEKYLHDLKTMAKGRNVTFRQSCSDEELVHAYRSAMCVVLPSVYKSMYGDETTVPELLGQTLLEGMACATPVICTNVASMPEVVDHEVTGFVVPPHDTGALREKLIWLRDHPQEARVMGTAGRQRVLQKFTWSKVVRSCLDIYAQP